jgi:pimeloyl-ACP methyl ester carboxylesterase
VSAVAFDLPGSGATPAPAESTGTASYVALVTSYLETLTSPVTLVGHSFGGRIAVQVAAARPELVKDLILTGVPLLRREGPARKSPVAYRLVRWARARGLVSEARLERARRTYGSADYRNATGVMRDVLVASVNESYADYLTRLQCPVTMVWGSRDEAVPVDVARRAAALITSPVELHVLEGVGHLVPTERPGALSQYLGATS